MSEARKRRKRIRHLFEYAGAMTLNYMIVFLPYRAILALAEIAGVVLYAIPPFRRLITANLHTAFPERNDREIRGIARRNAVNTALLALEFFWFNGKKERLDKLARFDDYTIDMLNKVGLNDKGAIWIPPHLGNWEMMGLKYMRVMGIKFAIVVRRMNNPHLDRFVNSGRSSEGARVIYAKGAVKDMLRMLRDKFHVATLIDQNTRVRDGGVFVDFFGLPVPASRAPAMFARKMNLPVAVACCVRENREYVIRTSLITMSAGDYSSDEELIQAIMDEVEKFIRQYPEQYLWLYERWRYIPETVDEDVRSRYPYYAEVVTPRFYDERAPKPPK